MRFFVDMKARSDIKIKARNAKCIPCSFYGGELSSEVQQNI